MKIGIDLGTANVIVYVRGKGIVLTEPSVVAVSDDNRIVAVGEEARKMLGRTPGNIEAIRPMRDGVIADYVITEAMLRFFIAKATKGRIGFSRPEVMISVPAGVTSVEKRAVRDAAQGRGQGGVPDRGAPGRGDRGQRPDQRAVRQHGHRHRRRDERDRRSSPSAASWSRPRCGSAATSSTSPSRRTFARSATWRSANERPEEVKIQIGTALPLERELRWRSAAATSSPACRARSRSRAPR